MEYEKSIKLGDFLKEFLRLLHNYLSSGFSLREHTYALKNKLGSEELNKEYDQEIKDRNMDRIGSFLNDLRRYTQHKRLPLVNANMAITMTNPKDGTGKLEQKLLLKKEELLKWGRLNHDSKKYLKGFNEEMNLKNLFQECQNAIQGFYEWFFHKVASFYSKEIEEYLELDSKIAQKETEIEK